MIHVKPSYEPMMMAAKNNFEEIYYIKKKNREREEKRKDRTQEILDTHVKKYCFSKSLIILSFTGIAPLLITLFPL